MKNKHKIKIDILIISDIHLGLNFSRVNELIEILNKYEFKKLILNGDIINGMNFNRLHTGHWKILSKIRKISNHHEVVWINGNHDGKSIYLSRLIGVKIYNHYSWRSGGKKFIAIHGHQFDRFLINNLIISNILFFIYDLIQKMAGYNNIFSKFIKEKNGTWLRLSGKVTSTAIKYANLNNAEFIFCGHTHIPGFKQKGNVKYYNSGSWVEKPSSYIIITKNKPSIIYVN